MNSIKREIMVKEGLRTVAVLTSIYVLIISCLRWISARAFDIDVYVGYLHVRGISTFLLDICACV